MGDPPDDPASDPDLSASPATADTLDALLGAAVHAPAETPGLAVGDELVGRYRIERLVGAGGMGAVYLAMDRTLERQVAIKLHHSRTGTSRLVREAVAMARLAHPNVITVFEVGEVGDQAFVAMEYVPGTTLRAWLGSAPRTVRERIAMLIGAGMGLAAAHDAGLVHRDFKPENILVGDDGRARVGDFGLARGSQSHGDVVEPHDADRDTMSSSLTRTGTVLGTPAYMAPEQANGDKVDARADQFAFCVVAWELLYGERPFAGANLRELLDAIAAGPRKPPRGARVRPAIRRVLERGLAVDPARRFADLHDALAALRHASRTPWAPIAIGSVAVLAVAAIGLLASQPTNRSSCDDAGADVKTGLPRDLPARLRAIGGPFAGDGADRVQYSIDHFAVRYRELAQVACRAKTIEHTWSADLLSRSTACLTLRLRTAAALVTVDDVRADGIPDLVQQAVQLPPLDGCVDPATLVAAPALPAEQTMLDAHVAARARLDAAAIEVSLGQLAAARATLAAVAVSPAIGDPAISSRVGLVRGGLLRAEDKIVPSEQAYRDAYFAARAIDDVDVTLPAVAALISLTGEVREDRPAAEDWIRNGLADALRARTRAPRAASSVYAIAAQVLVLEDNVPAATEQARLAVSLVDATKTLALVDALDAAAAASCAAGRDDECYATEQRELDLARSLLGPKHPRIGRQLAAMAFDRINSERHAEALDLATQAKAILDASLDTSSIEVAHTETTLADVILSGNVTDRLAEGQAMLVDARARLVRALGAEHPDVAQVDDDLAAYDNTTNHYEDAVKRLHSALAIQEHVFGPTSSAVADTLYTLAATNRDLKHYDVALAAAMRAAEIHAAQQPGSLRNALALTMAAAIANLAGDHANAYALATRALAMPAVHDGGFGRGWAAMEAGRSLVARRTDLAHARELLDEARGVFVTIKSDTRTAEVDALLAKLVH